MNKKSAFIVASDLYKKYGFVNSVQPYNCPLCKKQFLRVKRLKSYQIWQDYILGKQTYAQLAQKYNCLYSFF